MAKKQTQISIAYQALLEAQTILQVKHNDEATAEKVRQATSVFMMTLARIDRIAEEGVEPGVE